jgi:L-seryl-tRNA(Ser) seleniumtransferase
LRFGGVRDRAEKVGKFREDFEKEPDMSLRFGWSRRSFLSTLAALSGGLFVLGRLHAGRISGKRGESSKPSPGGPSVDGSPIVAIKTGLGSTGNLYAELGLTPIISQDIITVIGGSLMQPEVMEVMRMGNEHFVCVDELEVAAGKFIANLCKSPPGYTGLVTNGAAASILVGYAAMLSEDYEPRLEAIPDLNHFPKTEVIIQRAHRNAFDHQIRQTGAKLVVVETRDEMISAINPRTLAIHFDDASANWGKVSGPETVAIAKEHDLYTFCDASADVPPKSRLWEYPAIGFDMVTFSGGKQICGPQSSGILIGKENLIGWALMNMSPQEDRIGRPCKIGKEQIFALLKALEIFVHRDEDAAEKMYDARAQVVTNALAKFGVRASPGEYDPGAPINVMGYFKYEWDPAKIDLTGAQVLEALAATRPVAIGFVFPPNYDPDNGSHGIRGRPDPNWPPLDPNRYGGPGTPSAPDNPNSFSLSFSAMKDGEDKIVADRLVEIFSAAKKA